MCKRPIGTAFRNNSRIEVIKELKYFTKITALTYNERLADNPKLRVVYIPKTITSLGSNIFASTALQVVVMEAENPPATDTQFFRNVPQRGAVYVPQGCLSNYSAWASNTAYRPGYYKWAITDEEYNS